jgi:hypothetical protein
MLLSELFDADADSGSAPFGDVSYKQCKLSSTVFDTGGRCIAEDTTGSPQAGAVQAVDMPGNLVADRGK